MASLDPNIYLHVYYKGPYQRENWSVEIIDLEMEEANQELQANINLALPADEWQKLSFLMKNKGSPRFHEIRQVECPIELVKTLKLSAQIFQTAPYTSSPFCAKQNRLPIPIQEIPNFSEKESYAIYVLHKENTFEATFQKVEAVRNQSPLAADSSEEEGDLSDLEIPMPSSPMTASKPFEEDQSSASEPEKHLLPTSPNPPPKRTCFCPFF